MINKVEYKIIDLVTKRIKSKKIETTSVFDLILLLFIICYVNTLLFSSIFNKIITIILLLINIILVEVYNILSKEKNSIFFKILNYLKVYIFYSIIGIFAYNEIIFVNNYDFVYLLLGSLCGFLIIIHDNLFKNSKNDYLEKIICNSISVNIYTFILFVLMILINMVRVYIIVCFLLIIFLIVNKVIKKIRVKKMSYSF